MVVRDHEETYKDVVESCPIAATNQPEFLPPGPLPPDTGSTVDPQGKVELVSPDPLAVEPPPALAGAHVVVPVLAATHQDRLQGRAPPGEGMVQSVGKVREVEV